MLPEHPGARAWLLALKANLTAEKRQLLADLKKIEMELKDVEEELRTLARRNAMRRDLSAYSSPEPAAHSNSAE